MGVGKTFTNSIIREIGRNYGRAISNNLLGDKHSIPIRSVGSDITRKRGRTYHNKLDEHIQKFQIKGATATLNQGQNIHAAYFQLVDEANADGVLDLNEIAYLTELIPSTINTINRAKEALSEMGETGKGEILSSKIQDIKDFAEAMHNSLSEHDLNYESDNRKKIIGGLLSIASLDRVYFYPGNWKSYLSVVYILIGIAWTINVYINSADEGKLTGSIFVIGGFVFIYNFLWNPLSSGGIWKYLKVEKDKKQSIEIATTIKARLKNTITKF